MSLFVKITTQALTDAKLLAAGPEAFGVWARGLLYAKDHLTDGFVPDGAIPLVTLGAIDAAAVCARLVSLGLWEKCDGGYTVGQDRWARHQTTKEEVEEQRDGWRERKQRQREREAAERAAHESGAASSQETVTPVSRVTPPPETQTQSTESDSEHRDEERSVHAHRSIAHEIVCAHPKAIARSFTELDVTHAQLVAVLEAVKAECKASGCIPEIAEEMILTLTRDIATAVLEWPPAEQARMVKDVERFFRERDYRRPIEQWRYNGNGKRNRSQERTDGNLNNLRRAGGF